MHKDLYRARAAALSIIPTSTGAAKAVGLVLPELKGKLDGVSVRVPTPNVSLVDLKFLAKRATTVEEINKAIIAAAASGPLKGILDVVHDKLVSVDFNHNPASSSFALDQTKVMDGNFVSIMTWYDNEWGFSNRMGDTAVAMGKLALTACTVAKRVASKRKRMDYNTLDDLAVKGKRVLVRADLNVPLKDGVVTDATRIERQAPTIRELAEKGAKVIMLSHFDRPKGKVVPSMSLKPVVAPLAKADRPRLSPSPRIAWARKRKPPSRR